MRMVRRTLVCWWLVWLSASSSAADRPNILFIFSDDHSSKAVSAYDRSLIETPNIDRIARQGIRFDNCFATNSLCSPSRAVVLTGKHSHLNSKKGNNKGEVFDGGQVTFPKLLQKAGYQTALIGKWHLESEPTGFDHWSILPGQGHYYQPDFITPEGTISRRGYVTDVVTDMSLDWLQRERDPDKPFLLMCHHKAPHREVKPAIRHLDLLQGLDFPEPENLMEDLTARWGEEAPQGIRLDKVLDLTSSLRIPPDELGRKGKVPRNYQQGRARMTPEELSAWDRAYEQRITEFLEHRPRGQQLRQWMYQEIMRDYLRTVVAIDENVGRLLDYLDESGLADNTLVVYSSDQGFFLGEHGLFNKRYMYEESIRMPLVMRWPGHIPEGSQSDALVQNLDFAQTFLDAAGVAAPDEMQGMSLVPLLDGSAPISWLDEIYYRYYGSSGSFAVPAHYGVRTARYKLIYFYKLDLWELFDLENDPQEMENLANDPEHQGLLAEMKDRLRDVQIRYREKRPFSEAK